MTALVGTRLEVSCDRRPARHARDEPHLADVYGQTLGARLAGVWDGLLAVGVAVCPICAGRMERDAPGGAGRCPGCGAKLS